MQNGEFLAHGGAGIILSAGLMRMLPTSYMLVRRFAAGFCFLVLFRLQEGASLELAVPGWLGACR